MAPVVTSVVVLILGFICATSAYNAETDNQFHLFTRRNPTLSQPLLRGNADILAASNYDPRLRTILTIHGINGNAIDSYNQIVIPAILASDDVNLISVDWNGGTTLGPDVLLESGKNVAEFISWLKFFTGRPAEDFHIVAFSLGTHHAGVTGRYVDGGLGYITALDPAGGAFNEETRFQPDDALHTEAIFSNAGGIAFAGNLGHVNFYPNGGNNMPGCGGDNGCNHFRRFSRVTLDDDQSSSDHGRSNPTETSEEKRAVYYWAEAITDGGFTGTECASYEDARIGNCHLPGRLQIGTHLNNMGIRGTYYLQTNAGPPFSIY